MRLILTSTVRRSQCGEPSGFIHTVDLEQNRVTGSCPSPEPDLLIYEHNERGGMRGGKGIAVVGDCIYVANSSVIRAYNTKWELIENISHPSCAGIHDILSLNGSLWITSSQNDLVLEFDLGGHLLNYFNYRADRQLLSQLGFNVKNLLAQESIFSGRIDFRDPRSHQKDTYDRAHVNSLCFLSNGDMLVSLGRLTSKNTSFLLNAKVKLQNLGIWPFILKLSNAIEKQFYLKRKDQHTDLVIFRQQYRHAIVRVRKDGSATVLLNMPDTTTPNHSLLSLSDGTVLFDDTTHGEVVRFDPHNKRILSRIPVDNVFLRGICQISEDQIAVGSQRHLFLVDLVKGRVLKKIELSIDPRISIFAIAILPPEFAPLPAQLSQ